MTEAQKAEIRHDAILAITDDATLALRVIEPEEEAKRIGRLIAEGDDLTRAFIPFRYQPPDPLGFLLGLDDAKSQRGIVGDGQDCVVSDLSLLRLGHLDRMSGV